MRLMLSVCMALSAFAAFCGGPALAGVFYFCSILLPIIKRNVPKTFLVGLVALGMCAVNFVRIKRLK